MARQEFPYTFSPLLYIDPHERGDLEQQLADQGVSPLFSLHILRRKNAWATTLPPGAFEGDFRAGIATLAPEYARTFASARTPRITGSLGRRPFHATYKPTETSGRVYHHVEAIRALRPHIARPAFLNALYAFLLRAVEYPELVVPPAPGRPFIPHADRQRHFGLKQHYCRGPAWTDAEDAVLRRWFGQRTVGEHAGRHVRLSPAMWERVLSELDNRRTRPSIRQRLSDLNKQLLTEFAVGGLVPRARLTEYMSRAIGEMPRVPPVGGRRPSAPRPPLSPEEAASLAARVRPGSVPWTDAEDEILRRARRVTDDVIGRLPGRTIAAARQRASVLRRRVTVIATP